jgi:hypothetical protein
VDTALGSGSSADRSTESSFQAFRCGAPSTTTGRPARGSAWDQKERPPEVGARLKRCYSELLVLRNGDRTAVRLADRALSTAPVYGHGLTKNSESDGANVNVTHGGSHVRRLVLDGWIVCDTRHRRRRTGWCKFYIRLTYGL